MYAGASSPLAEDVSFASLSPSRARIALRRASALSVAEDIFLFLFGVCGGGTREREREVRQHACVTCHRTFGAHVDAFEAESGFASRPRPRTMPAKQDKATTERHAKVLRELLKKPENKVCADCKRNGV